MAKKELLLEGENDELEPEVTDGAEAEAEATATGPEPTDWDAYKDHHLGGVIDNEIMGDKEAQDAAFDQYITVKTQRKLNPEEVAPVAAAPEEDLETAASEESEEGED